MLEQRAVRGPEREVEVIRAGGSEEARRFRRKKEFAGPKRPSGAFAGRSRLLGAWWRRERFIVEAGAAWPGFARWAPRTTLERRRRASSRSGAKGCYATAQLLVNLVQQVNALELKDRDPEAAQDTGQQERNP